MEVGASLCLRCQRACDGTHSFNRKNRPDKIWNFNRSDLALAIDSNFFRKKKIYKNIYFVEAAAALQSANLSSTTTLLACS